MNITFEIEEEKKYYCIKSNFKEEKTLKKSFAYIYFTFLKAESFAKNICSAKCSAIIALYLHCDQVIAI